MSENCEGRGGEREGGRLPQAPVGFKETERIKVLLYLNREGKDIGRYGKVAFVCFHEEFSHYRCSITVIFRACSLSKNHIM